MPSKYIAQPPLKLGQGSGSGAKRQLGRMLGSILRIVWQTFVPFNPRPEEPTALPLPPIPRSKEQVAQCQWIFDQAETRRNTLEQKAQWTFGLILFLAPVIASLFLFLLRENATSSLSRTIALSLLAIAIALLLAAFVSIVRAVTVQARESLYLGAVVDLESGDFLKYDSGRHAAGLLYCSSVNTAMNDHLAQFVKGAHILTTAGVAVLLAAMIPAGIGFSSHVVKPTETSVVGTVKISNGDLASIKVEIGDLQKRLSRMPNTEGLAIRLDVLEKRLDKLKDKAP